MKMGLRSQPLPHFVIACFIIFIDYDNSLYILNNLSGVWFNCNLTFLSSDVVALSLEIV